MGIKGLTSFIQKKDIARNIDFTVSALDCAKQCLAKLAANPPNVTNVGELVKHLDHLDVVMDFSSFTRSYFIQRGYYKGALEGDINCLDAELVRFINALQCVCYVVDTTGVTISELSSDYDVQLNPEHKESHQVNEGRYLSVPVIRLHAVLDGGIEVLKADTWDSRRNQRMSDMGSLMDELSHSVYPNPPISDKWSFTRMSNITIQESLVRLGCRVSMADGDGDLATIILARKLNAFAILVNDSDYYIVPDLKTTYIVSSTDIQLKDYSSNIGLMASNVLTRYIKIVHDINPEIRFQLERFLFSKPQPLISNQQSKQKNITPASHAPQITFNKSLLPVIGDHFESAFIPKRLSTNCEECNLDVATCTLLNSTRQMFLDKQIPHVLGVCYRNPTQEAIMSTMISQAMSLLPAVSFLLEGTSMIGDLFVSELSKLKREILQLGAALRVEIPPFYRFHSVCHSHVVSKGILVPDVGRALELPLCALPFLGIVCLNDFMTETHLHKQLKNESYRGNIGLNQAISLLSQKISRSQSAQKLLTEFFGNIPLSSTPDTTRQRYIKALRQKLVINKDADKVSQTWGYTRHTSCELVPEDASHESFSKSSLFTLFLQSLCFKATPKPDNFMQVLATQNTSTIERVLSAANRTYRLLGHSVLYFPSSQKLQGKADVKELCPIEEMKGSKDGNVLDMVKISRNIFRMIFFNPIMLSDRARYTAPSRFSDDSNEERNPVEALLSDLQLALRVLSLSDTTHPLKDVWSFPDEPFSPKNSPVVTVTADADLISRVKRMCPNLDPSSLQELESMMKAGLNMPFPFVRYASSSAEYAVHIQFASILRRRSPIFGTRIIIRQKSGHESTSGISTKKNCFVLFPGTYDQVAVHAIKTSLFTSPIDMFEASLVQMQADEAQINLIRIMYNNLGSLSNSGSERFVYDVTDAYFLDFALKSSQVSHSMAQNSAHLWAPLWKTAWQHCVNESKSQIAQAVTTPFFVSDAFMGREAGQKVLSTLRSNVQFETPFFFQPLTIEMHAMKHRRFATLFRAQSPQMPISFAYSKALTSLGLQMPEAPLEKLRPLAPIRLIVQSLSHVAWNGDRQREDSLVKLSYREEDFKSPSNAVPYSDISKDIVYPLEFECIAIPQSLRDALLRLKRQTLAMEEAGFVHSSKSLEYVGWSEVPSKSNEFQSATSEAKAIESPSYRLLSEPVMRCVLDALVPYHFKILNNSPTDSLVSATSHLANHEGGLLQQWKASKTRADKATKPDSNFEDISRLLRVCQSIFLFSSLHPTDPSLITHLIIPYLDMTMEGLKEKVLPAHHHRIAPDRILLEDEERRVQWMLEHREPSLTSHYDSFNLLPCAPGWFAHMTANFHKVNRLRAVEFMDPYLGEAGHWSEIASSWRFLYLSIRGGHEYGQILRALGHSNDLSEGTSDVSSSYVRNLPQTQEEAFVSQEFKLSSFSDPNLVPPTKTSKSNCAFTSQELVVFGIDVLLLTSVLSIELSLASEHPVENKIQSFGIDVVNGTLSDSFLNAFVFDSDKISTKLSKYSKYDGLEVLRELLQDQPATSLIVDSIRRATIVSKCPEKDVWHRIVLSLSIAYDNSYNSSRCISSALGSPFKSLNAGVAHSCASAYSLATKLLQQEQFEIKKDSGLSDSLQLIESVSLMGRSDETFETYRFGICPIRVWCKFLALRSGVMAETKGQVFLGLRHNWSMMQEVNQVSEYPEEFESPLHLSDLRKQVTSAVISHRNHVLACADNADDSGDLNSRSIRFSLPSVAPDIGFSLCANKALHKDSSLCKCKAKALASSTNIDDILNMLAKL